MKSLFRLDSPILNFLSRMYDIAYLNLLCVLGCIPIITISTSVTALYYCMLKISREKDCSLTKMFFHSYFQNMKQGIKLTMIVIATGLFLYVDIQACKMMSNVLGKIINLVLFFLLIIWGMIVSYIFPLLAQFENTIKNIIRNAFLLSINHFFYTIIILFLNAIPVLLFFLLPHVFLMSVPLWLLFGTAAIAYINARSFVKIFDKYM